MRAPVAWRELGLIAVAHAALLIGFSARYGYHRDELYFIAIGGHPAFGYVDQPPLIPLLAHAIDAVSGGSLVALRVPSAMAGALIVLVTGLIAREFGATRGGQVLAAGCMAVGAVLMAVAHLMSTTTYDVLAWTVLSWTVVRALRDGGRAWLLVGLVAGIGLEIKTLIVFLLFALLVGVVVAGPRQVFRDRWLWVAGAITVGLWLPNLWWQAAHGWPQLELSAAIANGESGSSQPRWAFVPYQFLLVSPVLTPVWLTGLWQLWRDRDRRAWALAYAVLVVVFLATGGKPYYLAGMFPVLLAAGAGPVLAWVGSRRGRQVLLGAALTLSLAVSAVLFLPIVPRSTLPETPIVGINYDAGEQIGWPRLVQTVRDAYDGLPSGNAVIFTSNYGEAGALLHSDDPPPTYGRQNSLWDLGPPPETTRRAVVVNFDAAELHGWFRSVGRITSIDNGIDLDNDEQGVPVWVVSGPRESWSQVWDDMRELG